jgi:hypothetical protein
MGSGAESQRRRKGPLERFQACHCHFAADHSETVMRTGQPKLPLKRAVLPNAVEASPRIGDLAHEGPEARAHVPDIRRHPALGQTEFGGVGPDPVSIAILEAMQDQYAASIAFRLYLDHAERVCSVCGTTAPHRRDWVTVIEGVPTEGMAELAP